MCPLWVSIENEEIASEINFQILPRVPETLIFRRLKHFHSIRSDNQNFNDEFTISRRLSLIEVCLT